MRSKLQEKDWINNQDIDDWIEDRVKQLSQDSIDQWDEIFELICVHSDIHPAVYKIEGVCLTNSERVRLSTLYENCENIFIHMIKHPSVAELVEQIHRHIAKGELKDILKHR